MNRKYLSDSYVVYKNGEVFMRGTVKDICYKLDITNSAVCKAVQSKGLVRRKYRICYEECGSDTDRQPNS